MEMQHKNCRPTEEAAAGLEHAIKVAFHPDGHENLLPENCYSPIVTAIIALIDARLDERARANQLEETVREN